MLGLIRRLCSSNKEPQEGYRKFYLEADINRAKLAMLFFAIPVAGLVFNDYQFFNWSLQFFGLVALRLVLLAIIAIEVFYVTRVNSYRSYDIVVFSAAFAMLMGGGIVNVLRPQDFVVQAIVTIISVFVMFLVIPFRFLYQSILCSAATVGEGLIILLVVKPSSPSVLFTLLFSLFMSFLIGALGSWQLHSYRWSTYREFVKRKEMQDKLEQQSKHLEELVAERTEKLKNAERFAAIGATAGMVGHDLRNPLTGISNASYYLNKKYSQQLDQQGREMLQVIQNNVEYSNKIVGDLLDYSGNINLDSLTKTNPKLMVADSLAMITFPSNIELSDFSEDTPEINVDAVKIKRVLINIIKNAVDAMPQGGKLKISSERAASKVRISFTDTGLGISEEDQKKLFQPLFTTKAKGMGFGLAICQRIVEAHKGRIVVESAVGRGATFTVELPC
ncbi:MAG: ATP-binding protein [Chloroflexi bacterium]|nr:ATP-binding protein [Chloroflexota bacterium]